MWKKHKGKFNKVNSSLTKPTGQGNCFIPFGISLKQKLRKTAYFIGSNRSEIIVVLKYFYVYSL